MNLKTAFIGLAGVLAIPLTIAINGTKDDVEAVNHAADALAGKSTAVETTPEHKPDTQKITSMPGLGKFKLDEYKPKQP